MAKNKVEILMVFVTVPGLKDGSRISKGVLNSRLAACVTIIPGVRSMYWWEGKIARANEAMLVVKTTRNQYRRLERKIMELHPYEVPEIIAIPLVAGSPQYIEWVKREVVN
ncbi:MAG: divalent-cation tolerance protein CutA [Geobacteraceae bacterium]|jgi:periplasmic divalent cation tolerance protein|nr:MAG: divalent-cation tolerance protein CutA [Geobacteraceae bacterium]